MKTVAIIQARCGSTRLPRKVLAPLAGEPMVIRVLDRAKAILGLDEVVLATTVLPSDDDLAALVAARGWPVVRGSADDVLARYRQAAAEFNADVIMRLTADCPLLDPDVAGHVLAAFHAAPPCDYATNTVERTFPRGLDAEVCSRDALERAHRDGQTPAEREHVTVHIWRNPEKFRIRHVRDRVDRSALRWTVDTPEDFALAAAVYRYFGPQRTNFTYAEALELLTDHPELAALNAQVQQKHVGI